MKAYISPPGTQGAAGPTYQHFKYAPASRQTQIMMQNLANDEAYIGLKQVLVHKGVIGRSLTGVPRSPEIERQIFRLVINLVDILGDDIRMTIRQGKFSPKNARLIWAATDYLERRLDQTRTGDERPTGSMERVVDSWITELVKGFPELGRYV